MECENAKIALTSSKTANIKIGSTSKNDKEDDIHLEVSLSRAHFEKFNAESFRTIIDCVERALISAEMEKSYIDDIVLVGESTHMPEIQSLLKDFFSGKNVNTFIHSDEAVVYGAAVQAAVLLGETFDNIKKMTCIDINPHSLGFEIFNGWMNVIIERNRTLPIEETFDFNMIFSKFESALLKINIFEGESPLVQKNKLSGEFKSLKIKSTSNYIAHVEIRLVGKWKRHFRGFSIQFNVR